MAKGKPPTTARFGDEVPYTMTLRLRGVRPFLFNRMDIEGYEEEGPGKKKRPRAKPDYEDMVWRDDKGNLSAPTAHVIGSVCAAGKYFKTPIGSQGSARTTLQEGLVEGQELGNFLLSNGNGKPTNVKEWDVIDFRKANFGNQARSPKPTYRPRLEVGWLFETSIGVVTPELYGPAKLLEILTKAGQVMGIGDGRKIGMGRYVIDSYEVDEDLPW